MSTVPGRPKQARTAVRNTKHEDEGLPMSAAADAPVGSPAKPWLLDFVALAAIWGASFLCMRIATVELGALPTAAIRVAIASLALLPLLWFRGQLPQLRQHWRQVLLIGMLNSGIPFALFSFALLSITTGLSAILNATVPLFGAVIAWVWLKDRPNASRSLGLVVGFVGVALLAWDKASFKPDAHGIAPGWAVLACLLAAVCYGISGSYTKRYLTGVPPLVTATGSQIGATLGLALPALWFWPRTLAQPACLAGAGRAGPGVHRAGVHPVLPPDQQCGPGQGPDGDLCGAGVRGVLRRGVFRGNADPLDAGLRPGGGLRHGAVHRLAAPARLRHGSPHRSPHRIGLRQLHLQRTQGRCVWRGRRCLQAHAVHDG
jgi:drug/metabolite transporter (DMT)-like permease